MTPNTHVQSLDIVQNELKRLHAIPGNTWRRIAAMDAYSGIPPGTLCSIAKGRNPKKPEYRRILGLSKIVEINGKRYTLSEVGESGEL